MDMILKFKINEEKTLANWTKSDFDTSTTENPIYELFGIKINSINCHVYFPLNQQKQRTRSHI